jgi:putative flavoprotein involved in K+ transport
MPRSMGRWITRDGYIDYLERFGAHQRLDIRFGEHVRHLDRSPGGWCVATAAGDYATDHVIVATGYDRIPWLPDWPGSIGFPKPFLHVAALRRAADLAGLGVLLVGAGNSGVEIAGHGIDGLWCADLLNRG